jgi:hypothetical protein
MPIFCIDVNRVVDEKLVPITRQITRQNGASIGPDTLAIALDLVEMSPENGPFWEQQKRILFLQLPWLLSPIPLILPNTSAKIQKNFTD